MIRIAGKTGKDMGFLMSGNPYLFQGRRWDGAMGLYYYRNRYYSPRSGRFISQDPMGVWYDLSQAGNGFSSFINNPINSVDPIWYEENSIHLLIFFVNDYDSETSKDMYEDDVDKSTGLDNRALSNPKKKGKQEGDADFNHSKLIEKIKNTVSDEECIEKLTITGHGAPGYIGGIHVSALQSDYENEEKKLFKSLRLEFCDEEVIGIEFRSCYTGQGEEGDQFLKQVVKFAEVPATAWIGLHLSGSIPWIVNGSWGEKITKYPDQNTEGGDGN